MHSIISKIDQIVFHLGHLMAFSKNFHQGLVLRLIIQLALVKIEDSITISLLHTLHFFGMNAVGQCS